jgi:Protein of unknown function (DUF2637)
VTTLAITPETGTGYGPAVMTGVDRAIRVSTAVAVLAVAGVAAYVSYWHAYAVVCAHGETGITARLEPATIDGLVYASSMVNLYAVRHRLPVPALARLTGRLKVPEPSPRPGTRPADEELTRREHGGAAAADQRSVRARYRPAAVRVAQHRSQPRPVDLAQARRLLTGPRPPADPRAQAPLTTAPGHPHACQRASPS